MHTKTCERIIRLSNEVLPSSIPNPSAWKRIMIRQMLCSVAVCLLFLAASVAQQSPRKSWQFAVSGDSRNCGDVVMPAIAKKVLARKTEFYWHLGDFRIGYDVDEDMQPRLGDRMPINEYHKIAWDDFIEHQVAPFTPIPIHLGIGNHETYMNENTPDGQELSHAEFITKFSKWLGGSKTAYSHWRSHGVDFIRMDNSTNAGFDDAQMQWLEKLLQEDGKHAGVKTLVVGMHRALPNSLACGHSMNGDPSSSADDTLKSLQSGRRAYEDLWNFQRTTKKHVYVLASHSHFYMQDIFNTAYWQNYGETNDTAPRSAKQDNLKHLEGWLVGTAGAKRYRLPDNLPADTQAITYAYGYLLATVHNDGQIDFKFEQVIEDDVPPSVSHKYGNLVDYCFLANRDDTTHPPVDSCRDGESEPSP